MISAAIGAASALGGLVSSYFGYKNARREAANQDKLMADQRARLDDYYNRNYYGDYMSSAEAQNAMRRVEDSLRRRGQEAAGRAAINGGTAEAQLAQQENDQKALTDTASALAEQSTALKRQADQTYLQGQQALDRQALGMSQQRQAGYAQLGANGAELAKSGLLGVANSMGDIFDRAGKASGNGSAGANWLTGPQADEYYKQQKMNALYGI